MAAQKLPAIQFYPGDWHKDQGVQSLDLMQRGAWFEMLLMMHDSDERGVLLVNGQPMPEPVLARRLGLDNQTANQILTSLFAFGVASRRETDGAIYCRRMVKDEYIRQIRADAGKKGGNPNLLNQTAKQNGSKTEANANQSAKQIPTPSSSSSTTVREHGETGASAPETAPTLKAKQEAPKPTGPGFDLFWDGYAKKRGDKARAERLWKQLPEATRQTILHGLPAFLAITPDVKFRPDPATFLQQKRYEADDWNRPMAPAPVVAPPTTPGYIAPMPTNPAQDPNWNRPAGSTAALFF